MFAVTPGWVGDATAWVGLGIGLCTLAGLVFAGYRRARTGLGDVIRSEVRPISERIDNLDARLSEHMAAEERSAVDIANRLGRIERAAAQRIREVAEELASHRRDPHAHQ